MSIYGKITTVLWPGGTPGAPMGLLHRRLVIPLTFDLKIAGPVSDAFASVSQFCQDANGGIQIVVYAMDQDGDSVDISGASLLSLRFQRPDATAFNKDASLLTNGMDGAMQYTSSNTDFLMDGLWQVQASFTLAGDKKTSHWGSFTVYPNIIAP